MVKGRKRIIADLAIMGGRKKYDSPLLLGIPNITSQNKFHEMVDDIFQKQWLTNNGQYVRHFEQMIKDYLNVKNVIAVNNGTVALEIAIRSLCLSGEIIVPSYTFVATPHSILWSGAKPTFCDIDSTTYNIDVNKVESLLNETTKGIVAVDVYGRPSEKDKLESLAKDHGLSLIFDAAHSFGNSFHRKMIGGFGNAEIFSFHATKFLNTFEGGAITTNDDLLAQKMRAMRNFGLLDNQSSSYLGINGKMTEISAAMGIINLQNIEQIIRVNKANYEIYKKGLKSLQGIKLIEYSNDENCNYQYIIIEVDPLIAGLSRDELSVVLGAEGVSTRKYFWPACHQMEPYKTMFPGVGSRLPVTELVSKKVLALPTGMSVSHEDVLSICDIIEIALEEPNVIKSRIQKFMIEGNAK